MGFLTETDSLVGEEEDKKTRTDDGRRG
jgi:hypothetical protein